MKTKSYAGNNLIIKEDITKWLEQYKKKEPEMKQAVKKWAFKIQASSMRRPLMPVDTGALKNSMEAIQGETDSIWIIQDGVEYGVFQELGTSGNGPRKIPARHFLGHAAEINADGFFAEIHKILKDTNSEP